MLTRSCVWSFRCVRSCTTSCRKYSSLLTCCQAKVHERQGFSVYPFYRESLPSNNWSASWGWAQKCRICEATLLTPNQSMSAKIPPFKAAHACGAPSRELDKHLPQGSRHVDNVIDSQCSSAFD